MLKGSAGTSMQLEFIPGPKGKPCKKCMHLEYRGGPLPYVCLKKKKKKMTYDHKEENCKDYLKKA